MHSIVESELNAVSKLLADSSLKAYYRFNSGLLTADEKATYTLTNNNAVAEAAGKWGIGANFGNSNTNKNLSISNPMGIDGGIISLSCWVKLNAEIGSGSWAFTGQSNNTSKVAYMIFYDYNSGTRRLSFSRYKSNIGYQSAQYTITLGTSDWYHLVLTYDGTNIRGYVNGIQVAIQAASGNGNTVAVGSDFAIGTTGDFTDYASAIIDDVSIWSRALDSDEIKILSGYSTAATEIAKTIWDKHANLKLHYKFDETSGTDVYDSSGNSHNGVASAASIIANNIGGMFNNKGVFVSASSNKVTITDHADLKPSGNFSVGGWIKTLTTGSYQTIFQSCSNNSIVAGIVLHVTNGNVAEILSGKNTGATINTDYKLATGSTNVCDGNWHHVVGTYDGSTLKIYIDGKLESSVSWTNAAAFAATNYVRIGSECNTGTDITFMNGSIDDLFLLNGTALSAEQIREISEGRVPGELYPTTGLVGLWHMNGHSKDSLNTNNGTDTDIVYSIGNGKFKKGALFNSSSSKILLPNMAGFTNLITINMWINVTNFSSDWCVISSDSANAYYMGTNTSSKFLFGIKGTSFKLLTTTNSITAGTWMMVTLVYNGSNMYGYINGKLEVSDSQSGNLSYNETNKTYLGSYAGVSNFFNGKIDEVSIFNRALSATEIRKIYMKAIGRLQ